MNVFLSISKTANLLGISERAIQKNCKAEKYETRQVSGRGGLRYEIALTSLPKDAQDRYHAQQLNALVEKSAQQVAVKTNTLPVDFSELTEQQRNIHHHRTTVLKFIEEAVQAGRTVKEMIAYLNMAWAMKTLPTPMQYALEHAFEKRKPTQLAVKTYWNWVAEGKQRGSYAPMKRQKDYSVKPWHGMAVELYSRPQKPTMTWVHEKLVEQLGETAPSYMMVYKFFTEVYSQSDLMDGRYTGMARRALRHYTQRTADGLLPWDEIHADGWNTHFTAPHPITGDYVTYEVWDFHDVATRYVPPFSVGLRENYEVIAKGLENAVREGGVMAVWQTDGTKIVQKNQKFEGNPVMSICDRAGITLVSPVKDQDGGGNAQANGICENFHTWLDREARELATYQAKNMDSLTLKRTKKLTSKLVKAKAKGDVLTVDAMRKDIARVTKDSVLFESYQQVIDWLEEKRQKWNNHPCSALKKIRDNTTGKRRHQTPQECLDEFKANGWQAAQIDEMQIVDLFRPRVSCKVRRETVAPYNKDVRFWHKDLAHIEGQEVIVSYDIMDFSQVYVMDLKGSLICIAPYDAPSSYRAQTALETAQQKRAQAQVKLKEQQIQTIKQENSLMLESTTADIVSINRMPVFSQDLTDDDDSIDTSKAVSIGRFVPPVETKEEETLTHAETIQRLWGKKRSDDDEDDSLINRSFIYGNDV